MAERERRQGKLLAVTALRQAELTARALGGGRLPEVWEVFPFWTDEEIQGMRLAKYRQIMERYAAEGGGSPQKQTGRGGSFTTDG